jgi:3-methyladenine DNA glycosylase AlkD
VSALFQTSTVASDDFSDEYQIYDIEYSWTPTRVTTALEIQKTLRALGDAEYAAHSQRFFKTGKGEYGEGDRFLGIRVPMIRQQVRAFRGLPIAQTLKLLRSSWHEERLFALLMLVDGFNRGDKNDQREIYRRYIDNTQYINNWDLVDLSAHHIVGGWLADRSRRPLYPLAASKSLWERRIAIIATFYLIKNDDFDDALEIARRLLHDNHDLIHKAVGWMLREIGKRDVNIEKVFLDEHAATMPRTMLRYAIERLLDGDRRKYMNMKTTGQHRMPRL